MEDVGVVVGNKGRIAEVKILATNLCDKCDDKSNCAIEGMAGKNVTINAINDISAGIGDRVILLTNSSKEIKGALIGFGLPTLGLVLGTVVGIRYSISWAVAGAVLGMILPIIIFRLIQHFDKGSEDKLYPHIIRKTTEESYKP